MIRYSYGIDATRKERRVVVLFERHQWSWEDPDFDSRSIADCRGFDLTWLSFTWIVGINTDGLPNIKIFNLGHRLVGPEKTLEEENHDTRRTYRQGGTCYEIVEHTRVTFYERLYRWFGKAEERKRVWKVTGPGAPEFSFALPEWDSREPTDPEIIEEAFAVKALVESINFEE